jgi:hypothetical protein
MPNFELSNAVDIDLEHAARPAARVTPSRHMRECRGVGAPAGPDRHGSKPAGRETFALS